MDNDYNQETGLPIDQAYLECDLPTILIDSIKEMNEVWEQIDAGNKNVLWDDPYCELQSNINAAEVEGMITSEQAWYLREKYLRLRRDDK